MVSSVRVINQRKGYDALASIDTFRIRPFSQFLDAVLLHCNFDNFEDNLSPFAV